MTQLLKCVVPFADPESLIRGGPTLTTLFSLMREGGSKYHYKWAIIDFGRVPMMALH